QSIYGEGNDTLRDWSAGTPYPIINDEASNPPVAGDNRGVIAQAYQIEYYPTLFRVCANTGTTLELNQLTAPNLRNNLNGGCTAMTGVPNHAEIEIGNIYACGTTSDVFAKLKNYGNNNITSAIVTLKANGAVVATTNYSGNVAQFSSGTITFENVEINPEANYSVEVESVNGENLHYAPFGTAESDDAYVANTAEHVHLKVKVDTD